MNTQGEWSVVVPPLPLGSTTASAPSRSGSRRHSGHPAAGFARCEGRPLGHLPARLPRARPIRACARGFFGVLAHCALASPVARARPSLPPRVAAPAVRAGFRSLRSAGAVASAPPSRGRPPSAGPLLAPRARLCVRVAFRSVAHAAFARASGVAPPRRGGSIRPRWARSLCSRACFRSARPGPRRSCSSSAAVNTSGNFARLRRVVYKASRCSSGGKPPRHTCEPLSLSHLLTDHTACPRVHRAS